MSPCLNCGAELHGAFCSVCGQRVIPPYPTLREMAADAWHEFTGWDGRFARTFRTLLHPGALTVEVLEGRRARYVSPLRLYLAASVIYFLSAAAVPSLSPGQTTIQLDDRTFEVSRDMPAEDRAELLARLEKAPWLVQILLRPAIDDFQSVQAGFAETFPRALFLLVPVFGGIVALFYWRRRYPQHLIFALHLHAAVFLLLAVARLSNVTRIEILVTIAGLAASVAAVAYALKAFHVVYGGPWRWIVVKSIGIGLAYFVAVTLAVLATFAWAVLT